MKFQAASRVVLSMALPLLPSCCAFSDYGTRRLYTKSLDDKVVSSSSNQPTNTNIMCAGYYMGCVTWPIATFIPTIEEPVKQISEGVSSEPRESQPRLISFDLNEKLPSTSRDETCYMQQLILTLLLLGATAFALSSNKPSEKKNDKERSLTEEFDMELEIELAPTEEEGDDSVEDDAIASTPKNNGTGIGQHHLASDCSEKKDANPSTLSDEPPATAECDEADDDEGVPSTSLKPAAAATPSDVTKRRIIFHDISTNILNTWSVADGHCSKEEEDGEGDCMLNSFEGFLCEVKQSLH